MPFLFAEVSFNQEVDAMRKDKYNLVLDELRYDLIVFSLIEFKNKLTNEGRYTDAVDNALIKVVNAKRKVYYETLALKIKSA